MALTNEQEKILTTKAKRVVVSASAGSGKTFVLIEKLIDLICNKKVPLSRLLVLTFTKAAASEMRTRLYNAILEQPSSTYMLEQIDDISISDISTIDSFCEKILKRNIDKLDIEDNFVIIDEQESGKLKRSAFQKTYEFYAQQRPDFLEEILFAFKRNEEEIEKCVYNLQSILNSDQSFEERLKALSKDVEKNNANAEEYLKKQLFKNIEKAKSVLEKCEVDFDEIPKSVGVFIEGCKKIINVDFSLGLFEICNLLNQTSLPALPRGYCDGNLKEKLSYAKELIKEAVDLAENFKGFDAFLQEKAKKASLTISLASFLKDYINEYSYIKKKKGVLDFADIEMLAQKLLAFDEVKKSLQERYDYIFIDEYQDTNKLQESILKPIADGGFFTAVGDIKQGIYGFRNASMDIMKKDISSFSADNDGDALYLRGNFRTDNTILQFINKIFEKVMTEESCGIDYKKTSMLEGLQTFKKGDMPAVIVDILDVQEPHEEEMPEIYSVKEDVCHGKDKNKQEVLLIAERIEKALASKIYDAKMGKHRQVRENDIALLFRNRNSLMRETVNFLQNKGFDVNADLKELLIEDSQVAVIISLLKLTLNLNDDIALASVMCSPFGNFTIDELAQFRLGNRDTSLAETVLTNGDDKIKRLLSIIEKLKFECVVFGITKALERLFVEVNYYKYLRLFDDYKTKLAHISDLFKFIHKNGLDQNVWGVITQIANANNAVKSEGGGNSITVSTIHASKGLEYPIVILCSCGENPRRPYKENYILTKEFGLATYLYDYDDDKKYSSPAFVAGKLKKKKNEFVDEIMIFYVAMTRAQNHLFIIGSGKEKDFSFEEVDGQNNYLKMIMYALGENFTSLLFSQEQIETENCQFNVVYNVDEKEEKYNGEEEREESESFKTHVEEYNKFVYPNKENCKVNFKNSVTGILNLEEEFIPVQTDNNVSRKESIKIGNSYHEALKLLNLEKIKNLDDVKCELEKIKTQMTEGYFERLDEEILLKNILIINSVVCERKVFKEKSFIMKSKLCEVLNDNNCEQSVIVQGVVDLFAIGEKNVLIDFKYTSIFDDEKLINKYYKQIKLYSIALEKAFGRKVDEKYLLSLKYGKLVKIEG